MREDILAKPVTHKPGTYWYYSGGHVNLLGEYFEAVTRAAIDDFSVSHLFEPLGISDVQWQYITPDVVYAAAELELRPQDIAKFGYLYLNDGVWNGTQVIPPDWVAASLEEQVAIPGRTGDGDGYAYARRDRSVGEIARSLREHEGIVRWAQLDLNQ